MSDYSKLKRCLAAYRRQIIPIAKDISEFDIVTHSINHIGQWKNSLAAVKDKHQSFIEKMMVLDNADLDEIDDLAELFRAQFSEAMISLEIFEESTTRIERHRRHSEQRKVTLEILLIQLEEAEAFKCTYHAEKSTLGELRLRLRHLKQMREKFISAFNEIIPPSENSCQTLLNALNAKFSTLFLIVSEWLDEEIEHRTNVKGSEC